MPLSQKHHSVARLLKEKTLEAHHRSENYLLPFLSNIQSLDDYAAILKMFYGFFHPVEQMIQAKLPVTVMDDIKERGNARLVLDDLTVS